MRVTVIYKLFEPKLIEPKESASRILLTRGRSMHGDLTIVLGMAVASLR